MAPTNHIGVSGKVSTGLTTASIGLGILAGIASFFTGGASLAAYMGYMAAVAGIAAGAAGVSSAVGEKKAGVSTWKRDLGISIGTGLLSAATFGAGAAISAGAKSSMALNTYRVGVGVGLGMGTYGAIDQSVKVGKGETQLGKGHVWDTLNFTNAIVGGVMSVGQAGGIGVGMSKGATSTKNIPKPTSSVQQTDLFTFSSFGTPETTTKPTLGFSNFKTNVMEPTKTVFGSGKTDLQSFGAKEQQNFTTEKNSIIGAPERLEKYTNEQSWLEKTFYSQKPEAIRTRFEESLTVKHSNAVGFSMVPLPKLSRPIAINAGMNISAATAGLGIGSQSSQASEEAMYQSTVTTVTVGIDNQS